MSAAQRPTGGKPTAKSDNAGVNKVDWRLLEGRRVKLLLASGESLEASVLKVYSYTLHVLVGGRQALINKIHVVKAELL